MHSPRTRLASFTLGIVLTACTPTSSISLTVNPSEIALVPGGSTTILVTLTRSGSVTGDVSLTASAPAGLTPTLSDSTLVASETMTEITISAEVGLAEGHYTVTVNASASGLNATAEAVVDVAPQTVSGSVIGLYEEPIPGITVYIAGLPPTVTDAEGRFAIEGVTVPYDLTVAHGQLWAQTFVGLATPSPAVQAFFASLEAPPLPRTTVSGDLTGSFTPVPADVAVVVCPEGLDQVIWARPNCAQISEGGTDYEIELVWSDGAAADVRLRAYAYEMDPLGAVTDILGSGSVTVEVSDALALTQDVSLAAAGPALADIVLNLSAPAGFELSARTVLNLPGGRSIAGPDSRVPTSPIGLVAPSVNGAQYTVVAQGSSGNGSTGRWVTGIHTGEAVSIAISHAPSIISPESGDTGLAPGTLLIADKQLEGSVHFAVLPQSGGTVRMVSTVEESVPLPDLSAIGITMEDSEPYVLQLLTTPHETEADAMVTAPGYVGNYFGMLRSGTGGPAPSADGEIYLTSGITVTSQ